MKLQATQATKAILGGPIHLSSTFWAQLVSAAAGLPALLASLHAIPGLTLPTWLTHLMLIIAAAAMWAAPHFARNAGVNASGVVAEQAGIMPIIADAPGVPAIDVAPRPGQMP